MPSRFQKRRRFGDSASVAVLDIGASKVSCFIAHGIAPDATPMDIEIVGAGHSGLSLRDARAQYVEQLEKSIRTAVDAAEKMAGERISRVCVAVKGASLNSRRIGVDLEIAGGVITAEDVNVSLQEGYRLAADEGYEALHAFPILFRVDGEDSFADPTGFSGNMLSTELVSISARQSIIGNLTTLIERCGLKVDEFIAAPYAAGEAVLYEDEKELGAVIIDIGAGSTSYAIYDHGALMAVGGVGLGGGHITKDVAAIFGGSLADAERAKTMHGAALSGPGDEHRFVELASLDGGDERVRASRADLIDVITPRLEEIFELVAGRLSESGGLDYGVRRAVVTGGGAQLVGVCETCERVLGMKTRIGRPMIAAGAPEAVSGPAFAVTAGLIHHLSALNSRRGATLGLESPMQSRYAGSFRLVGGIESWLRARF